MAQPTRRAADCAVWVGDPCPPTRCVRYRSITAKHQTNAYPSLCVWFGCVASLCGSAVWHSPLCGSAVWHSALWFRLCGTPRCRHNQISQVDPSWVGPQSKLKVVNLQNNLLTAGSLMAVVRHPLKLNALSLASNSLTTVPSWIVEHCGSAAHPDPVESVWLPTSDGLTHAAHHVHTAHAQDVGAAVPGRQRPGRAAGEPGDLAIAAIPDPRREPVAARPASNAAAQPHRCVQIQGRWGTGR